LDEIERPLNIGGICLNASLQCCYEKSYGKSRRIMIFIGDFLVFFPSVGMMSGIFDMHRE